MKTTELHEPTPTSLKCVPAVYMVWEDNVFDMKKFCGDNCSITYEIAPGIGGYYSLNILDCLQGRTYINVPLHHYVVKINDMFMVLSPEVFDTFFYKEV